MLRPLEKPTRTNHLNVLVASDAVPDRNGVGTYYKDLCQHLAHEVGEITLIAPEYGAADLDFLSVPMLGDNTQRIYFPSFLRLYSKMRECQPDVVIVATPGPYALMAARIGARLGAQVLVGFHTSFEHLSELYWTYTGKIVKGYFQFSNYMLFRQADEVVAISDHMLDLAENLGAQNPQLVGTPVSYDFLHTPVNTPSNQIKSVLFAGRLAAEKNIEAVLAAAKQLPNVQFNIAGDGPDIAKVHKAMETCDNITPLGWLSRKELLDEMDCNDVVVLPSHVEGFGTIALEAMARQRFSLVSQNCGIVQWPELAEGLFQIGEDESVADALTRMMQMSPIERSEIAERGREAAIDLNQWNLDLWVGLLGTMSQQPANVFA